MSEIPESVQRQLDEAQAEVAETETPATEAEAESQPVSDEVGVEVPETTEEPVAEEVPDYRAQYQTLQGKYNAEVPRLNQDLKARDAKIAALESEIAKVDLDRMSLDEMKEAFDLPEEVTDLGEETTRIMLKVAQSKPKQPETTPEPETQDNSMFYDVLTDAVPDWDAVNGSPGFQDWLRANPTKNDELRGSQSANRPGTAIRIFGEYAARPQSVRPKTSLAAQVQPARSAGTQTVAEKPTMSAAEYEEAMSDLTKQRMSPEKATARLAELTTMLKEGRVRAA